MNTDQSISLKAFRVQSVRCVVALAILLCSVPLVAAARRERVIDSWKPVNYNVSLTFNDKLTEITHARAEISVLLLKEKVSEIDLDFGELEIDSVTIADRTARYHRAPGALRVILSKPMPRGTRFVIVVSYHGKPKDGLILANDKAGMASAIGDNWPNRLHHWIPCLDHPSAKATVSFTVTAPTENTVVANGQLTKVETAANASRTWTYNEAVPIPPYCMIVAVGDFAELQPSQTKITPLVYYVPQPDKKFAMQGFAPANPSLEFFSETIAPYPYEKLALIIGATRFGGMENSSAIVFSSTLFDPRPVAEPMSKTFNVRSGIVSLVAHEIAHQWFGDSVTESTWSDLWLSEGFATYFAGLFIQREEGEEAFQEYMKNAADKYFSYERKIHTPIHDSDTEDLFKLLNPNNYEKGAWVLHMLRSELGDKDFFSGVRRYYTEHRNATATTDDLRLAFEKVSGQDLREFFRRWIYGAGHPQYDLSWEWVGKEKKVKLVLKQTQTGAGFPNSLPLEIVMPSGKRRITLKPTGKQTIQELKLDEAPSAVSLDPENTILKEARVMPTPNRLKATSRTRAAHAI
ncbi:MAG: M1 family metallopeptidase [Pyrinomonadaceae bacterium]|nr:M1 family metallopeptidase [Pyrinomonadaceae bacterium]